MINTNGNLLKLLFSAFIVIILGLVLIQPIADDVDEVSTSSYPITNETLSFTDVTTVISNESHANLGNDTTGGTFSLTYNDLAALTEIRNESAAAITGDCNATLSSGYFVCNATNTTNFYVDYTYISGKIETLEYDDLTAFSALRNITSEDIISFCNVTLSTGALVCNNTYSGTGYADYTYESDVAYVRSSTTRTLLTLTVLLFTIAVISVGIGYAVKSLKEGNLM